jgi:hypothetical protein
MLTVVVDAPSIIRGGEVSEMTTTLKPQTQTTPEPVTTLEHVDIHRALDIPTTPPVAAEPPRRRWAGKTLAVGLTAALLGLAAGYGAAAWNYNDQVNRLENQTQLMTQVPFGGFSSEYGAAREHLAQAEIVAARTPQTFTNEYSAPREHLVLAEIMEARA